MILELDTKLFDTFKDLSTHQILFLALLLNENQKGYQDIRNFLSRIDENEIKELIDYKYVKLNKTPIYEEYDVTDKFRDIIKPDKTLFDQFYDLFPAVVDRPDGTRGYLRANINKCRKEYNHIISKSQAMHEHILECLKFEIERKTMTGKLGYFKTMWKWLTQHEWEVIEAEMKETESIETNSYGTTLF